MKEKRIKRIKKYLDDEPFLLTYGDGVSDVDIAELVDFHKKHGKLATLTVVNAGQRFGVIKMGKANEISSFSHPNSLSYLLFFLINSEA